MFLAVLCLWFAHARLHFTNDRTRMLDPDHPAQQHFEQYRQAFGAHPEVVILVTSSDQALRQACVQALLKQLKEETRLQDLAGVLDLPLLPQQALYYASEEALAGLEDRLKQALQMREGALSSQPQVTRELLHSLRSRGHEAYQSPFGPTPPQLETRRYLQLSPDTLVVVARVNSGPDDDGLLDRLRQKVEQVRAHHAGVDVALGGDFAAFCDDARSARRTALQVSLLSLVLVHSFFRWSFGRPQPARLALLTVLIALCWSCAWAAWATPTLNLITINFTATLIGLGMDFNVQMLYRFFEERERSADVQEALKRTQDSVGRENLVGALATSAAFFSLTATPFLGVAQLGLISGVGVLLCWLASVTILPALLLIFAAQGTAPPPGPWEGWEQSWRTRPRLVLLGAALITLVASFNLARPRFDYNLLHMMPATALAIENDRAFHERCGMCSLYACSLATSETEMRRRTEAFRKLPGVARVESPADWLPENPQSRRQRIHDLLLSATGTAAPEWLAQLPAAGQRLSTAQLLSLKQRFRGGDPRIQAVLSDLGPGPIQDGLSHFFGEFKRDLEKRRAWLAAQKVEPMPSWEQIPPDLLQRYHQGSLWLIKIYPKQDIWEKAPLEEFLTELSGVDPKVTGLPILTHTYLQQIKNSYWVAGRNALIAISLILFVSFRRLDETLWALAPKLLGMIWMLGAMGILGVNFNPANATSLPLTLGIGLVFGVHVVHRMRNHPEQGVFAGSTGNAVLVSGVSTVLGYISLVTSSYRGIASLGLIMGLGVISSLVASLVVLPVARQSSSRQA
ncbi:MMPL family transporter [bacterium]|nr:MMPL family transporter [bacterium]